MSRDQMYRAMAETMIEHIQFDASECFVGCPERVCMDMPFTECQERLADALKERLEVAK